MGEFSFIVVFGVCVVRYLVVIHHMEGVSHVVCAVWGVESLSDFFSFPFSFLLEGCEIVIVSKEVRMDRSAANLAVPNEKKAVMKIPT
jgi:hypothetical protein